MERLTSWNEDCVLINGHALGYATKCELVQMAERLAAYEDSRLSPQACAQAAEIEKQLASYDFSAKKMLEFIRADKAGRCVVLPCKVGDTVWRIVRDGNPHITRDEVRDMYFADDMTLCVELVGGRVTFTEKFGKTVFLTREEAERAMEGKKNGNKTSL